MDNAQKAIMIGVGLFITIIVIAAVMMITGIGQDLINSGTKQLGSMGDDLDESLKSNYDQVSWSGRQVAAEIRKLTEREDLAVYVVTARNSNLTACTATGTTNNGTAAKPYSVNKSYIKASSGTLTVSSNGTASTITGVTVTNAMLETQASTDLSNALKAISASNKYKSALITNTTTGRTMGIVFVRID